jgi:hypothetical protein
MRDLSKLAVMLVSGAAPFLPPRRGTCFKQRPQRFGRFRWAGISGQDRHGSNAPSLKSPESLTVPTAGMCGTSVAAKLTAFAA